MLECSEGTPTGDSVLPAAGRCASGGNGQGACVNFGVCGLTLQILG